MVLQKPLLFVSNIYIKLNIVCFYLQALKLKVTNKQAQPLLY